MPRQQLNPTVHSLWGLDSGFLNLNQQDDSINSHVQEPLIYSTHLRLVFISLYQSIHMRL